MHDIIQQLEERRAKARLGGGEKRIAAQHGKGAQDQGQDDSHDDSRGLGSASLTRIAGPLRKLSTGPGRLCPAPVPGTLRRKAGPEQRGPAANDGTPLGSG